MESKGRSKIMRKMKIVLVAFVIGILSVEIGFFDLKKVSLSAIILSDSFSGVDFLPQYIPMFTLRYMPLFFFQINFSTYIYKHFCSASVYFFSRNINRKKWFFIETLKIYMYAIVYLVVSCLTQILLIGMFTRITVDREAIIIIFYFIIIYSLYLLLTTISINIVSIMSNSSIGFIVMQGMLLLSSSIFFLMGKNIENGYLTNKMILLIKSNLIANLIFPFHSSRICKVDRLINIKDINFDLNFSLICYLVLCVCVVLMGSIVVEKHEFITNNKEI